MRGTLLRFGLVNPHTSTFDEDSFRAVLEASPVVQKEGTERFLEGGQIRQYPVNLTERSELLRWIAQAVFSADEVLTEAEVNESLDLYSEDVAVLRRYLVDRQLVERRSDGTEYVLTGADPVVIVD